MFAEPLTHGHHITWLLHCPKTQVAALIDPVSDDTQRYNDMFDELGLTLKVVLHTRPAAIGELTDQHVSPHQDCTGVRLALHMPGGALLLRWAHESRGDASRFLMRLGEVEVRVTSGSADAAEVAYIVGDAIFTGTYLRGEGSPCTSQVLCGMPHSYRVHAGLGQGGPAVRSLEDELKKGLRVTQIGTYSVPDPSSTVPATARRAGRSQLAR